MGSIAYYYKDILELYQDGNSVKEIADKLGIEANMKNMGVLMKSTMAELKDKADGSAVNKAVKEFLSGK